MQKRYAKVCIILFVLLPIFGCSQIDIQSNESPDEWKLFMREDFGFSFEYPANWHLTDYRETSGGRRSKDVQVKISRQEIAAWIYLRKISIPDPSYEKALIQVNEHLDQNSESIGFQAPPGFEEVVFEENINNIPVMRRRYTFFANTSITEQVFIPVGEQMFVLELSAPEESWERSHRDFLKITNSLKLLEE